MQTDGAFLTREDRLKVAVVVAIVAADALWIWLAGYRFQWDGALKLLTILPVLLLISQFYRRFRPNPVFAVLTTETAWLLAFVGAAAIFSNLVVTLNFPAVDRQLVAIDRFFGFDWEAYYGFFTTRPYLGLVAAVLYVAALPMLAIAVIGVSLLGRPERAQELVFAAMVGALIAIAISIVLPAAGGIGWFWPDATGLPHRPIVDRAYEQTFFDLRAGLVTDFSLDGAKGMIAFPSYHATLSTLVILAFRGVGLLFWPILVVSTAIILTTPIEGGHHLVDAAAGIVVALVSVWIAAVWRRRLAAGGAAPAAVWFTRSGPSTVPGETA